MNFKHQLFNAFTNSPTHQLPTSQFTTDDLTPVIQFPSNGGSNQRWTLEPLADGYVRIVARHSGKALDVAGGSLDDGAPVIQYTPHDGANQQWLLRTIAP